MSIKALALRSIAREARNRRRLQPRTRIYPLCPFPERGEGREAGDRSMTDTPDTPLLNTAAQPSVIDFNDAGDALTALDLAIGRLVVIAGRPGGRAALADQAALIHWQRCRLANILAELGSPVLSRLREAS